MIRTRLCLFQALSERKDQGPDLGVNMKIRGRRMEAESPRQEWLAISGEGLRPAGCTLSEKKKKVAWKMNDQRRFSAHNIEVTLYLSEMYEQILFSRAWTLVVSKEEFCFLFAPLTLEGTNG